MYGLQSGDLIEVVTTDEKNQNTEYKKSDASQMEYIGFYSITYLPAEVRS